MSKFGEPVYIIDKFFKKVIDIIPSKGEGNVSIRESYEKILNTNPSSYISISKEELKDYL